MANKWVKLINFFGLLDNIVDSISGELRQTIVDSLIKARVAANATDNKYDDILIDLLCFIFQVPKE